MTFTFNQQRAMVMTHAHAYNQDQRSTGQKIEDVNKQTERRTRPIAVLCLLVWLANIV